MLKMPEGIYLDEATTSGPLCRHSAVHPWPNERPSLVVASPFRPRPRRRRRQFKRQTNERASRKAQPREDPSPLQLPYIRRLVPQEPRPGRCRFRPGRQKPGSPTAIRAPFFGPQVFPLVASPRRNPTTYYEREMNRFHFFLISNPTECPTLVSKGVSGVSRGIPHPPTSHGESTAHPASTPPSRGARSCRPAST